jgi:hypothetical protein
LTKYVSDITPTLTKGLDICVDRIDNSIRTRLDQAEGTIYTTFQAELKSLSNQIEEITNGNDAKRALLHSFGQTLDYHGRMLVSIQEAVLTKSQLRDEDVIHQGHQLISRNVAKCKRGKKPLESKRLPRVGILDWPCTCSTTQADMVIHEPGCILLQSTVKRKLTATVRLLVLGRLLQGKLKIEFDPRAWARDFRVYPNFSMSATVPYYAPAFTIVHETRWGIEGSRSTEELEILVVKALLKLRQVFANGDGSPSDLDCSGKNLLHVSTWLLR